MTASTSAAATKMELLGPMKRASFRIGASLLVASLAYGQGLGSIDLRGVVLGSTCEQAIRQELSLNSQPVMSVDQMMNIHVLGFHDLRTPNEPKLIMYGCDESGHIAHFSIVIASRDQPSAANIYARTKADFEAKYGPPANDSDRYNALQKNLLAGVFESALSQWTDLDHQSLTISVEDRPDPKGAWNVSIVVGRPFGKR
jgi:hypothetical protein